jgi:hypothetical protein
VYISFAYRLGVGRLEAFLPLAMVVPGTIYLILVFDVGVGCFAKLGDFVEVTFCLFIGMLFSDGLTVPVVLVADCADEELVSARNWDFSCWYFILACNGRGPLLGWFFVELQVSSLLLRAISVGFEEAFFRPPVVVPAVADLLLVGLGEEVADACSMIRLRLNGGDGVDGSCGSKLTFGFFVVSGENFGRSMALASWASSSRRLEIFK